MCDSTGGRHGILKLHLINVSVCGRESCQTGGHQCQQQTNTHTHKHARFRVISQGLWRAHTADCRMLVGESVSNQHEVAQTSNILPNKHHHSMKRLEKSVLFPSRLTNGHLWTFYTLVEPHLKISNTAKMNNGYFKVWDEDKDICVWYLISSRKILTFSDVGLFSLLE